MLALLSVLAFVGSIAVVLAQAPNPASSARAFEVASIKPASNQPPAGLVQLPPGDGIQSLRDQLSDRSRGDDGALQRGTDVAVALFLSTEVDRAIVDRTGLNGGYDIELTFQNDRGAGPVSG